MTAWFDEKRGWPNEHVKGQGGPDDGRLRFPASLYAIVLDAVPHGRAASGVIYLDELLVTEQAAPRAQTNPASPVAGTAPSVSSALAGHIVYAAANGGTTDVMVLDVPTGGVRRLFPNARQPDISRNTSRVVFNGVGGGKNNIFSINLDGSGEIMNGNYPEDSYPHWSPSGVSAVFHSTIGDGNEHIYTQRDMSHAEEPQPLKVKEQGVLGRFPTWLENWRIAYSGCDYWDPVARGSHCGIWTVNSDGSGAPQQLTEQMADHTTDSAGGVLLYVSQATGNWDIYAIPAAGGAPRNLTSSPSQEVGATFSPDGARIAFMSDRGGGWGIWVMDADGGNQQKLATVANGFGSDWPHERLAWGP